MFLAYEASSRCAWNGAQQKKNATTTATVNRKQTKKQTDQYTESESKSKIHFARHVSNWWKSFTISNILLFTSDAKIALNSKIAGMGSMMGSGSPNAIYNLKFMWFCSLLVIPYFVRIFMYIFGVARHWASSGKCISHVH